VKTTLNFLDKGASSGCPVTACWLLFILYRVAAAALDCLGRNGPRGGRRYCRACGQKTMRIRPQEYLREGRLQPLCPRCGGPTIQFLPILTGKLAGRALRRWPDLSACSSHQLRHVVRTEKKLMRQGRIPRNMSSPNASSSLRRSDMRAQEWLQTTNRKSRMSSQEPPSRYQCRSGPRSRGNCCDLDSSSNSSTNA
jgi:hypothetical protein